MIRSQTLADTLAIRAYVHCNKCLAELKTQPALRDAFTAQQYAALDVGLTDAGLQVWCKRHDCNVMHIDFQGHNHPAVRAKAAGDA